MTARNLISAAYGVLIDDLRHVGLTLGEAMTEIGNWFAPDPTAEEIAARAAAEEAEAMRRNEETMKNLAAWGGGIPPRRGKAAPA